MFSGPTFFNLCWINNMGLCTQRSSNYPLRLCFLRGNELGMAFVLDRRNAEPNSFQIAAQACHAGTPSSGAALFIPPSESGEQLVPCLTWPWEGRGKAACSAVSLLPGTLSHPQPLPASCLSYWRQSAAWDIGLCNKDWR